jgi:hypothetical protein
MTDDDRSADTLSPRDKLLRDLDHVREAGAKLRQRVIDALTRSAEDTLIDSPGVAASDDRPRRAPHRSDESG